MDGTNPYPEIENLMDAIAQYAPIMASVLQTLRPVIDPYATSILGASPWEMQNPVSSQSSAGMFTAADASVWNQQKSNYRQLMGYSTRSDTVLGGVLKQVSRNYLDKAAMGDNAYALAMRRAGVGFSFARSVFGAPEDMSLAGGASMGDITAAFVDTAAMPFHGLAPGERQFVLERMARVDPRLLNGYAGDVSGIRGKTTLDPTTGMLQADSSLDTETSGMLERVNKLRRGVKEMDAAMAAWKEVLNRDVKQSMDAMSALFGGDAVATFSGSGDILQRMALRVRHTAALTGNEAGYIMGGVGNTMRMFGSLGAPQEASLMGSTLATSFAANLGGYRGDQGSMEQRTALSIGHAVASPYGRLIAGAYVRYLGSEQGIREGVGSQSREGFRRLIEGYRGENGFTAESLNAALATVGVGAVSDRDYRRRADTDVGADYLSQDAYVATETFLESNRRARRTFLSRDKNAAAVAAAMGEGAFFTAMGLNPGDREAAIRGGLESKGWNADQIRTTMSGLRENTYQLLTNLLRSGYGGFENRDPNMSPAALLRSISPTTEAEFRAREEEINARIRLNEYRSKSGTLLEAGARLLRDNFSGESSVSLKGLFSAVTGLEGKDANLFYKMGGGTDAEKTAFIKSMQRASKVLTDAGVSADSMVPDMWRELRSAYDRGDEKAIALAQQDITNVMAGSFDGDQYVLTGGSAGSATEAISRYKARTSSTAMQDTLYRSAAGIRVRDKATGKFIRESDWGKALEKGKESDVSLISLGMNVAERERAAVAAAMTMTIERLASPQTVEAYKKQADGSYVSSSGRKIDSAQYESMLQSSKTASSMKTLLKSTQFQEGDADQVQKGKELLMSSEEGAKRLEEAMIAAAANKQQFSWEEIINMFINQLSQTVLRTTGA